MFKRPIDVQKAFNVATERRGKKRKREKREERRGREKGKRERERERHSLLIVSMSSSGLFLVCRGCNGNSRLGGACPSSSFSRQQTAAAATSSGRRGGGETETEKDRSERLLRERERPAKVMARRGIASRRESEKLMQAGHVRINGTIHKDPGQKIPSDSNICIIPGR